MLDQRTRDAEIEALRDTNRRLNRRVQHLERESAKEDRLSGLRDAQRQVRYYQDRMRDFHDFERMMSAHGELKKCFEAAAEVLGLPHGRYHSVMDSRVKVPPKPYLEMERSRGTVYANVFPNYPKGGCESYPVVETVQRACRLIGRVRRRRGHKAA